MEELIGYIVESLTGNSDFDVAISEKERLITITLSPDDIGRVIGKQGHIAKAIRVVMRAAGNRNNEKVQVEID